MSALPAAGTPTSADRAFPAPPALGDWAAGRALHTFTDAHGARWDYRDNQRTSALPPLVLLPGALGTADTAWQVAEAFDAERRVVAVTYPGGRSADTLADGLAALLDHAGTGPVALWGSSYGAWWAQAFALRLPERVAALWLGNTFVDGGDVAFSPLFEKAWLDAVDGDAVVARWHAALSARPNDPLRAVQLHMLHHGLAPEALRGRLRQVAHAAALPAATGIARTVVCDCDDDPTITPPVRARVRARYPGARHVALAHGGHYPHIVAAGALVEAMRAWLR